MPKRRRRIREIDPARTLIVLIVLGLFGLPGWLAGLSPEYRWVFMGSIFFCGVIGIAIAGLVIFVWVPHWGRQKHIARLEEQRQLDDLATANLLYRQLVDLSPTEFEKAMCKLFEMNGFTVEHAGRTSDGGVDMRMERKGLKYIGQCKRYDKNPVTVEQIRDFYGALTHSGADHGYFITTSRFTRPAVKWARHKPLTLVDGPALKAQIAGQANQLRRL